MVFVLAVASVTAGLLVAGTTLLVHGSKAAVDVELRPDDVALVAAGQVIYMQQCALCHGVRLQGEPDWTQRHPDGKLPAPPHDASGHTWHHSDRDLFLITKFGPKAFAGDDYPTDMPGYEDKLSDRDIVAVLSFIKSHWPADVRSRHDRMNAEARKAR